ncbi:MAG: hypothetical protein H0X17_11765 [Deltaproteobacteria bacterium]|nr:hypothetical protein [Deltaproteobacteria bacterium]
MKRPLLALAVISTLGYGTYRMIGSSPPAAADSEQLVLDRIWIDHIPTTDTDTVQVFVAITDEPFGAFQAASQWRGAFELFRYERDGDEIRAHYPQTGERETVTTKARRCSEGAMDFCLELDGGTRGVKRYYSRKGWEIDGITTPAELEARSAAVRASLR